MPWAFPSSWRHGQADRPVSGLQAGRRSPLLTETCQRHGFQFHRFLAPGGQGGLRVTPPWEHTDWERGRGHAEASVGAGRIWQ